MYYRIKFRGNWTGWTRCDNFGCNTENALVNLLLQDGNWSSGDTDNPAGTWCAHVILGINGLQVATPAFPDGNTTEFFFRGVYNGTPQTNWYKITGTKV